MIADTEELEEMDATEIHARRLHAKEVLTPMKGDNFTLPVADGTIKTPGGDRRLRTRERNKKFSTRIRRTLFSKPFKMTQHGMMRKLKMIFGLSREISFTAITWNPESYCTCRGKNHLLVR